MASSCLRRASSKSSTACAKPASSGNSRAEALPLMVWATRNISSSSSRLPGSVSAAIRCCSLRSRPSSDSARNAATTFSRSKSISPLSFLNALAPDDAVVGVKHDFSAAGSTRFLNEHGNSRIPHQLERGGHVLLAEADGGAITSLEHGRSTENFGLEMRKPAPQRLQHLEQRSGRHICEARGHRVTFTRRRKEEMIHTSHAKPAVPEANRHARTEDGADLARVGAHVELAGQKVCALAFSDGGPA